MGKKKDKEAEDKKVTDVTINDHLADMLKDHSDKKSEEIEKKSS